MKTISEANPIEIFRRPRSQETDFGLAVWQSRPVIIGESHQHNDVEAVCMDRGTMSLLYGGRFEVLSPGSVAIFWAGRPHQVMARSEDAFCRGLSVPLRWFMGCGFPEGLVGPILGAELLSVPLEDEVGDFLELNPQWLEDLYLDTPPRNRVMLLEVEAWFHRVAAYVDRVGTPPNTREVTRCPIEGMEKVEAITSYISTHYGEPISAAECAEAAGLQSDHAVHLFHQVTGCTLVDFINQQRLAHAQLLLAATETTVLDIALEAGFGSASRFYALFKGALGMSPTEFRRQMQSIHAKHPA